MSLTSREPMRKCGRRYATEAAALTSKRGLSGDFLAVPCRCDGWHLHEVKSAPAARPERKPARVIIRDTIPSLVRSAVGSRDSHLCVRCGASRNLHCHHRRLKGSGGDPRPHTDCACNLVLLCALCHVWVHELDRRSAEAEGLILPGSTAFPGEHEVMVHSPYGSGATAWPTCDGQWVPFPPGEVVAC